MKRLKFFIVIFCVALSIPLAYLVLQTYRGLAQEEESTLRYFAETLFDELEKELASLVINEEVRVIWFQVQLMRRLRPCPGCRKTATLSAIFKTTRTDPFKPLWWKMKKTFQVIESAWWPSSRK